MFKNFKDLFHKDVYLAHAKQPLSYLSQPCFTEFLVEKFFSTAIVYVGADPLQYNYLKVRIMN
jgi:hypothetical protein